MIPTSAPSSIQAILDIRRLEPGKTATDAIRQAAKDLNFAGAYGARVRLTGPVPMANEEYATVQDGAITNGIGTVVIMLIILWLACIRPKIIFAVFVKFVRRSLRSPPRRLMMVGSLTCCRSPSRCCFVGLGVDSAFQFSVRYRSEPFKNDDLALAAGERRGSCVAVPLSLAAMATAAASCASCDRLQGHL